MSLDYLIHDFHTICLQLKRHTRTIFVDMGASLAFHWLQDSPAVYINKIYRKFGIHFDHIYAYEITETKPKDAYAKVPEEMMSSFHWINLGEEVVCLLDSMICTCLTYIHLHPFSGVDPEPGSKMNPFTTLLKNFNEDDFVVVKLDIDSPVLKTRWPINYGTILIFSRLWMCFITNIMLCRPNYLGIGRLVRGGVRLGDHWS